MRHGNYNRSSIKLTCNILGIRDVLNLPYDVHLKHCSALQCIIALKTAQLNATEDAALCQRPSIEAGTVAQKLALTNGACRVLL